MAREKIAMSLDEVTQFLANQHWIVLGSLDPDGSPWADLAACTLEGERLFFSVCRGSRSHKNLERDPRVCCSIDSFPSYYEIQGVTVHGSVRREEDTATRMQLSPHLSFPGVPVSDGTGEVSDFYSLPLDDVFSFDFGRIKRRL